MVPRSVSPGLWENWKDPATGEWVRTFAVITLPSNELITQIHDRMPAILRPADYERWLSTEPDPQDLLLTFPAEPMKMWPISKPVNSPQNDDESLLTEIDLSLASRASTGTGFQAIAAVDSERLMHRDAIGDTRSQRQQRFLPLLQVKRPCR